MSRHAVAFHPAHPAGGKHTPQVFLVEEVDVFGIVIGSGGDGDEQGALTDPHGLGQRRFGVGDMFQHFQL